MIRAPFRAELEKQQTVLVLVWVAFLVAVLMFLWIPRLLREQSQVPESGVAVEIIRQILWVLGLIEIGFLVWWKRYFLRKRTILRRAEKTAFFPSLVRGHETPEEERAGRVVSHYLVGKVASFAIAEALAINGFVLAWSGSYFWDQYILSFVSVLFLLYLYPSESFLVDILNLAGGR